MASEAQVRKLTAFAVKHKLLYQEINQREYGPFEPILSLDGENWLHTGEVFGWGWHPVYVTAELLTRHVDSNELATLFGLERIAELKALLAESDEPPVEQELVSGE